MRCAITTCCGLIAIHLSSDLWNWWRHFLQYWGSECVQSLLSPNTHGYLLWRTVCNSVMNDWCLHPATHTHTHTQPHRQRHTRANTFCHHTVSNSLRFASLTSTSQSLCTAAGEADTHSHTHTIFPAPLPYFLEGKRRGERKCKAAPCFAPCLRNCCWIQTSRQTIRDFFPYAESSFKDFWEYRHYKRNMLDLTGPPANAN